MRMQEYIIDNLINYISNILIVINITDNSKLK